jgi:Domain of unknown function (DUF6398)
MFEKKMDKQKIKIQQQKIWELVEGFCNKKLDKEYLRLSEKLLEKLRKQANVPFKTGQPEVWAAAIIHALGSINFLFDKSFEPYVSFDEINQYFNTKKTTVSTKSKQIRDFFDMGKFDQEFSTKQIEEMNPYNQFVMVDGLLVPIDALPEEYQEMVKQARALGRDISFKSIT